MNSIEKTWVQETLKVLYFVRDSLTARTLTVHAFMDVMGEVSGIIKRLENLNFGCSSGIHAGACRCKPGQPGAHKHG